MVLMLPQTASIAVSAIRDGPVIENGAAMVGRRMNLTLSCDHRALDGVQAAQFLTEFTRRLEHPREFLVEGSPAT